jgi:hypothetical protein
MAGPKSRSERRDNGVLMARVDIRLLVVLAALLIGGGIVAAIGMR